MDSKQLEFFAVDVMGWELEKQKFATDYPMKMPIYTMPDDWMYTREWQPHKDIAQAMMLLKSIKPTKEVRMMITEQGDYTCLLISDCMSDLGDSYESLEQAICNAVLKAKGYKDE